MPKIYSKQQKEHALYLITSLNDYAVVSQMLGIPQSTLRTWLSDYAHTPPHERVLRPRKSPDADYDSPDQSAPTPAQIRDKLLAQIDLLLTTPTSDPRQAYHTALATRALLEQVRTLNRAIGIEVPAEPILPDKPDKPDTNPTE